MYNYMDLARNKMKEKKKVLMNAHKRTLQLGKSTHHATDKPIILFLKVAL